MKNKAVFWIVTLILLIALYLIVFLDEPKNLGNVKNLIKLVFLLILYISLRFGKTYKKKPSISVFRKYEDIYADIIGEAFTSDKPSRRKLLTAINHYNNDDCKKAVKALDKLKAKCETPQDITAVLMFKALSCKEMGLLDATINCYNELLETDAYNSRAWSNLGNAYLANGDIESALNACENAIRYDPSNAFAYNNLGAVYLERENFEKALDYAQRALKLNDTLYQAAGKAAVACSGLGDRDKAEAYYRIYNSVGNGNAKSLRKAMDIAYGKYTAH